MWTYIFRRLLLMIPTLLGVTAVSFGVMYMAPGDPLLAKAGDASPSGQTREAYLLQRRELRLDLPAFLNTHYFTNHGPSVRAAASILGRSREQIEELLPKLAQGGAADAELKAFVGRLAISDFDAKLGDARKHPGLAGELLIRAQIFAEDEGAHGIAPAIAIVTDEAAESPLRIGAVKALNRMVINPFRFTFSVNPGRDEADVVKKSWRVWWDRAQEEFPPIDPDRLTVLEERLAEMVQDPDSAKLYELLEGFEREDMRFFAEKLLADTAPFEQQVVSAIALKLYISEPLRLDVPLDASAEDISEVAKNWQVFFDARKSEYSWSFGQKVRGLLTDTQYANMLWRLVTFQFGRSSLPTREPVGERIWAGLKNSVPLMMLSQLFIYAVAVPLGVLAAVRRGRFTDRATVFSLLVLYSIPGFVAGMLFLVYFCYGYTFQPIAVLPPIQMKFFPMLGLHSEEAHKLSLIPWLLDYLWHLTLPVLCLSLFSLASMAMYSRSSLLDVFDQDYIRTARARGLPEWKVIIKHALRNGLMPVITLFANFLPAMLGGSVLIEYLFGIPGMGRLSWASIDQKDIPTLMAVLYVDAIVVMLSILASDLLYVVVDPRINFSSRDAT